MTLPKLPSFKSLPLRDGDPFHSAWGLYGEHDELGTMNLLTDDVVREAGKELKTGRRIGLKPCFGRKGTSLHIICGGGAGNDDELHFNTQCSSQIDGLRHFGYQKAQKFYNGVTEDQIVGPKATLVNGVQSTARRLLVLTTDWAKKGYAGRGVLLDWCKWAEQKGISFDPLKTHKIPLEQLKQVAKDQNVDFKLGDILIVRSGFIRQLSSMDVTAQTAYTTTKSMTAIGVEQSVEMMEFIWENHFSLVAGDTAAFEAWPTDKDYYLHEVVIAGFGCGIGELWNLEELSEYCAEQNRYTFFFTAEPLNMPGGVATPPNAMAIF